jgi:hypothetical protein
VVISPDDFDIVIGLFAFIVTVSSVSAMLLLADLLGVGERQHRYNKLKGEISGPWVGIWQHKHLRWVSLVWTQVSGVRLVVRSQ